MRASYVGAQTHHAFYYAGDINKPNVQQPNVPLQAQRPYQPWGQINHTHTDGKMNFNQMQLELNKRFSSGFLIQAEYSFTRSLDNVPLVGGAQNPYNQNADYGNTDSVPRHILVGQLSLRIAVRAWPNSSTSPTAFLDGVAGGWSVVRHHHLSEPARPSPLLHCSSSIIGWWGGRPDAVAGADLYAGQVRLARHRQGRAVVQPGRLRAAAAVAVRQFSRNNVFGPGFWNWDIGVQKTFSITENHRLQLRGDGLNAFNHFNLGNPSARLRIPAMADCRSERREDLRRQWKST